MSAGGLHHQHPVQEEDRVPTGSVIKILVFVVLATLFCVFWAWAAMKLRVKAMDREGTSKPERVVRPREAGGATPVDQTLFGGEAEGYSHGMLERQRRDLASYGWADQGKGIARMPVERAIDLLVEAQGELPGLPPPAQHLHDHSGAGGPQVLVPAPATPAGAGAPEAGGATAPGSDKPQASETEAGATGTPDAAPGGTTVPPPPPAGQTTPTPSGGPGGAPPGDEPAAAPGVPGAEPARGPRIAPDGRPLPTPPAGKKNEGPRPPGGAR